ncbi:fasciclin domain-containing protein [Leptolyngbya sp. 'hensonii']|uniref:fasciclin domain-containing protein n=1 Tax=Leptolyngbya sp. 'hensonii' TaxID=1922337 RepID=UPI000AB264B1|nr:fasciclin domain-containing protein [Leptolyngbya sp. 'hensonii']
MKYSFKSITGFAGILGLTLGAGLPVSAQLNPNPTIFQEPPYAPVQRNYTTEIMVPVSDQPQTISQILKRSNSFTILNALLPVADQGQSGGFVSMLDSNGSYTVFAPTDQAFAELPAGVVKALVQPENRDLLLQLLSYHVVPRSYMATDIRTGELKTSNGAMLTIRPGDSSATATVMVNDASVIKPDIQASNGVIQVIDRVMIPPKLQSRINALALGPSTLERYRALTQDSNAPRTGNRIPNGSDMTPGRGNIFTPGSGNQLPGSVPANQYPDSSDISNPQGGSRSSEPSANPAIPNPGSTPMSPNPSQPLSPSTPSTP